jgi:hypothetical protein
MLAFLEFQVECAIVGLITGYAIGTILHLVL